MNDSTLRYLRALAHGSRTMRSFSHGGQAVHVNVVTHHMELLEDLGYIARTGHRNEVVYAITPQGERYLSSRPPVAQSRYVCNAAVSERYVPPAWPVRAGADDHKRARSLG